MVQNMSNLSDVDPQASVGLVSCRRKVIAALHGHVSPSTETARLVVRRMPDSCVVHGAVLEPYTAGRLQRQHRAFYRLAEQARRMLVQKRRHDGAHGDIEQRQDRRHLSKLCPVCPTRHLRT